MTRAELLSIGSELLLGETVDTNAAFLGGELARDRPAAAQVRACLPDDRARHRRRLRARRATRSDVVLATGGLGPTHDDLTREGLADALGEDAAPRTPALVAVLEERFRALRPDAGREPAPGACAIPSAEALPNPIGSAPGWWVDRDGVGGRRSCPACRPRCAGCGPSRCGRGWRRASGCRRWPIRTVKAFGIGESALAERLGELLTAPPAGVDAGIYARDDGVHVRFSTARRRGDA